MYRRLLGSGFAALVLSGLAIFSFAPAASADTCNNERNVYIRGGESHYTLTCSGGNIYVNGRVTDTSADGKCVQVKALINGRWFESARACPKGTTKYFSWSGRGNTAHVYTQLV